MPIRAYVCKCGRVTDELFWKDYPRSISCPNCGGKAEHRFMDTHYPGEKQPKRYKVDFRAGFDIGANRWFDTKKDRERYCIETGCTYRKDMS